MPLPLAIPAVASAIGGIMGNRSANRNQREANRLQRRALDSAEQNYNARDPFRQAAYGALTTPGTDYQSFFDPSMYEDEPVPYQMSERRTGAQTAARGALANAQNIDREGLIRSRLNRFDTESSPVLEAQYRRAGQKAAALGGLGSGNLNTELGEFTARRARDRDVLQGELIDQATEDEVNDAYRALAATREEEAFAREDDESAYGRATSNRDRRSVLGRQALLDRLMLGEQNRADESSRLGRAQTFAGIGFGNDPGDALQRGAGYYGDQANTAAQAAGMNWSVLGDLAGQYSGSPRARRGGQSVSQGYDV